VLYPYIGHKCVRRKVKVAGGVEEGKIKSSTFFSQIRCNERRDEEWAIPRIALCNGLLRLSPNLGNGDTPIDCADRLF
jgi:hypothetical protein